MSTSKDAKTQDLPTECYLFVRFWRDWNSDSNFPFYQFNALPDDRFAADVEEFVLSNDECKAKFTETLKACWSRSSHPPTRHVRNDIDTQYRRIEVESWAWGDIQALAKALGLSPDKEKPDLIEDILGAEERDLQYRASFGRRKPMHEGKNSPENWLKKMLAQASVYQYAHAAGWVHRLPLHRTASIKDQLLTSRRQIVWLANDRQEAERLTAALQDRYDGQQPYSRFGVLPVEDFTLAQRITIKRNIDTLRGTDRIPSHVANKLYLPDNLRSLVQEAAIIAEMLQAPDHQCAGVDADETDTRDADQHVKQQRGRKRKYKEADDKEIIAKWNTFKPHGTREQFAREKNIPIRALKAAQDRQKHRNNPK